MKNRIALQHNESYWLADEKLQHAYSAMGADTFSRYPDYSELTELLATYAGVTPDKVLVTNGSDAAVRLIAEIEHAAGHKVLLPVPSFYGYEKIFTQIGLNFDTVSFTESQGEFIFPLDEVRALIVDGGYSTLFICQPNNPLGSAIPEATMEALIALCADVGIRIVIDEAYFEFLGRTSIAAISRGDVVILRTLSKAFALAGARVGYVCATTDYLNQLSIRMLPWQVSNPSVFAACTGLRLIDHVRDRIELIKKEREVFVGELQAIDDLKVYPSETNFVLIRVARGDAIAANLKERGVDVATCSWMSGDPVARALLTDTIRMAVPSPEDRETVVHTLRLAIAAKS